MRGVKFEDGMVLDGEMLEKMIKTIYKAMEETLPPNMQTYEVCQYILNACKDDLGNREIDLTGVKPLGGRGDGGA